VTLLTPVAANTRTAHTVDDRIVSAMLMLSPALESGKNLCAFASRGCADACLYFSGRGAMPLTQQHRINRTRRFNEDRDGFVWELAREIETLVARSHRLDCASGSRSTVAIRLNGTSDILWERIPYGDFPNLMAAYPGVQFYDYTKVPRRRDLPANYHLTFSLSEVNDAHAATELANGCNLAVVMRYAGLPSTWSGYPVVYGDASDYRFLDPAGGHIVALRANGRALRDRSGFVRGVDDVLDPSRRFVPHTLSPVVIPTVHQPLLLGVAS